MKQYPEYKPSGIDWIGEIPSHWNRWRLKFTGTFGNGLTYSPNEVVENGICVLRSSNIQDGKLSLDDNVYVTECPQKLMTEIGDIIICSRNGSANLVGKCALISEKINATFGAFMLRYRPFINSKFAYYLFTTTYRKYRGLFATTTINQLTKSVIDTMNVPLPPLAEQEAIADFLDKKCGEIDSLIKKQQRRIELLDELRQTTITNAVTHGINPHDASLKDSGFEWLGQVPSHWKLHRIKDFTFFVTEKSQSDNKIGLENIVSKYAKYIQSDSEFEGDGIAFSFNDIIYGKLRPYLQKVWLAEFEGNAVGDFFVFRATKKSYPPFLKYLFLCYGFTQMTNSSVEGAKMPRVSSDFIRSLHYYLPPFVEQKTIASYLDSECYKIDKQIARIKREFELLEEYKQSVIAEVVTGKRRVYDIETPSIIYETEPHYTPSIAAEP